VRSKTKRKKSGGRQIKDHFKRGKKLADKGKRQLRTMRARLKKDFTARRESRWGIPISTGNGTGEHRSGEK